MTKNTLSIFNEQHSEIQSLYFDETFRNFIESARCLVGDLVSIKTDGISPTKTKGYVVKTLVNAYGETMIGVSQDNRICYDLETGEIVETPIRWYSRERLDDNVRDRYKLKNIGYLSCQRQIICVREKKNSEYKYHLLRFINKFKDDSSTFYYNMDDETLIDIYTRKNGYSFEVLPWTIEKNDFFYKKTGCYAYVPDDIGEAKDRFESGDKNVVKIEDVLSGRSKFFIRPKFNINPKINTEEIKTEETSFDSFINKNAKKIKEILDIDDNQFYFSKK